MNLYRHQIALETITVQMRHRFSLLLSAFKQFFNPHKAREFDVPAERRAPSEAVALRNSLRNSRLGKVSFKWKSSDGSRFGIEQQCFHIALSKGEPESAPVARMLSVKTSSGTFVVLFMVRPNERLLEQFVVESGGVRPGKALKDLLVRINRVGKLRNARWRQMADICGETVGQGSLMTLLDRLRPSIALKLVEKMLRDQGHLGAELHAA